jgi:hypothetical protein
MSIRQKRRTSLLLNMINEYSTGKTSGMMVGRRWFLGADFRAEPFVLFLSRTLE